MSTILYVTTNSISINTFWAEFLVGNITPLSIYFKAVFLVGNIAGSLIAFLAFVAFLNGVLSWWRNCSIVL